MALGLCLSFVFCPKTYNLGSWNDLANNQKHLDHSRHDNHHDHHSHYQVANVGRTHLALSRKAEKVVSLYYCIMIYDTMWEKRTFSPVEILNSQLFCKQMNKNKKGKLGCLASQWKRPTVTLAMFPRMARLNLECSTKYNQRVSLSIAKSNEWTFQVELWWIFSKCKI